jgi:hypothetical protein
MLQDSDLGICREGIAHSCVTKSPKILDVLRSYLIF